MNMIACCKNHLLVVLLLIAFHPSRAEIVVKTFHDVNNNGVQEQSELLITGLTVIGYDDLGDDYPFLDDGAGTFTLEIVPSRIRVHVQGYNATLMEGVAGPSSVFFASDGDIILVPVSTGTQITAGTSDVLIPCYESGASQLKSESPAFVSFPYEATGVAQQYGGSGPNPDIDATIEQIGSTWGVGYQPTFQRAFASAILKRHVGLGPEGLGGVYVFDYSGGQVEIDQFSLQGINPSVGPAINVGSLMR
ncbi:MAG: hypothetical protein OEQ53_05495, partial [Saprospiraceae bacterium]|nr:hypothetical protein [Saprospiraceae bacterium]